MSSALGSPPPPAVIGPRDPVPSTVTAAMWSIVTGAGLEMVDGASSAAVFLTGHARDTGAAVGAVVWALLASGVLTALALGVRRGSRAARLATTTLGVGWVLTTPVHTAPWTVSVVVGALEVVLVVGTLVLVHLPASTRWFDGSAAAAERALRTVDPAVHEARRAGWRVLGLVVGLGLPASLVWAFLVAWWASDGCSGGSTRPECGTTTLLLQAGAPAIATLLATVITVVGLLVAGARPDLGDRMVRAGAGAWFAVGIGLYVLAQHV